MTHLIVVSLLAGVVLCAASQGAKAQGEGRRLAETWCSDCHVVGPKQRRASSTGAPTFIAIAEMKIATPAWLHGILMTRHDRMPDLHLSRVEMDDLAAYILSLRQVAPQD